MPMLEAIEMRDINHHMPRFPERSRSALQVQCLGPSLREYEVSMGEQVHKKRMGEGVFYTRCKYTRYRVSTPELLSYLSKGLVYPELSLIARI